MAAIDKQTAATLFAFGFKLVDKEGKEYKINGILHDFLVCSRRKKPCKVNFNQIGTDFWVLKRDFSMLTKSITVEGEKEMPLKVLAKIAHPNSKEWFEALGDVVCLESEIGFSYDGRDFETWKTHNEVITVTYNQEKLFQKLYSLHFIDLPEGTYKLIDK